MQMATFPGRKHGHSEGVTAARGTDVRDLVELSRLLVGVAYRSLEAPARPLPLPQFRALAVLAQQGPCGAGSLAEALDLVPSTVTRVCDKLVVAGLITRRTRPGNRREVELDVTDPGREIVEEVLTARAAELEQVLRLMPRESRRRLAAALPDLLRAADRHSAQARHTWAV